MFRVLAKLLRQDALECRRARSLRAAAVAAADAVEPGAGCGWFDSSWELRQGLKVVEYMDSDPLPAGVPLDWLLQQAA